MNNQNTRNLARTINDDPKVFMTKDKELIDYVELKKIVLSNRNYKHYLGLLRSYEYFLTFCSKRGQRNDNFNEELVKFSLFLKEILRVSTSYNFNIRNLSNLAKKLEKLRNFSDRARRVDGRFIAEFRINENFKYLPEVSHTGSYLTVDIRQFLLLFLQDPIGFFLYDRNKFPIIPILNYIGSEGVDTSLFDDFNERGSTSSFISFLEGFCSRDRKSLTKEDITDMIAFMEAFIGSYRVFKPRFLQDRNFFKHLTLNYLYILRYPDYYPSGDPMSPIVVKKYVKTYNEIAETQYVDQYEGYYDPNTGDSYTQEDMYNSPPNSSSNKWSEDFEALEGYYNPETEEPYTQEDRYQLGNRSEFFSFSMNDYTERRSAKEIEKDKSRPFFNKSGKKIYGEVYVKEHTNKKVSKNIPELVRAFVVSIDELSLDGGHPMESKEFMKEANRMFDKLSNEDKKIFVLEIFYNFRLNYNHFRKYSFIKWFLDSKNKVLKVQIKSMLEDDSNPISFSMNDYEERILGFDIL